MGLKILLNSICMKKIILILFIIVPFRFVKGKNDLNLEQIKNAMFSINNLLETDTINTDVKADSLINSYKTISGYRDEHMPWHTPSYELGNRLVNRIHHLDSRFTFSYVSFSLEEQILNVKFTLYTYSIDLDTTELISYGRFLNYKVETSIGEIKFFKNNSTAQNNFSKAFPYVKFNITPIDRHLIHQVEYINNPVNHLVYGKACGVGGEAPYGLDVMAALNHYKEYETIVQLLFSPNPVTRLYAAMTLDYLYNENIYVGSAVINDEVKGVFQEKTLIEICNGCSPGNMSIKDAKVFLEKGMLKPFDSYVFVRTK